MDNKNVMLNKIKTQIKKYRHNSFFTNFIYMLTGDSMASMINLITLTVAVKTIGLEGNGIIIMMQAYTGLFTNLVSFQSFDALVKYLPYSLKKENLLKSKLYIKQGLLLDIISVILALIFALLSLNFISRFMNWDNDIKKYIWLYAFTIVFDITGTSIGLIRIFDKFKLKTSINIVISVFKFIIYFVGFYFKLDIIYFIHGEILLNILNSTSIVFLGYLTLKENKLLDFYKCKLKFDKEFIVFNLYSNLVSTLDLPINYLSSFFIAKLLGFNDLSVYKIFEKIGSIFNKVGSPIYQLLYPEMCKEIANDDIKKARNINDKLFKYMSCIGLITLFFILASYKLWLGLVLPNYESYILSFVIYIFMCIYCNSSIGVHPLFMALGYIKYNVLIMIICNTIYLFLLYLLELKFSLIGVVIARLMQPMLVNACKIFIMKKNNYALIKMT